MALSLNKQRRQAIAVRIDSEVVDRVREVASARGVSVTSVVEDALKYFLEEVVTGKASRQSNEALRLERQLKAIGRDIAALGELGGAFVFNWMCHLTPIPEAGRAAAKAMGRMRYLKFMEHVKCRGNTPESLWHMLESDTHPAADVNGANEEDILSVQNQ